MIFEDLGPVLRTEREKKGLSIDDVALHLKISGRVIRALEEGDEDDLPHNVYVRGFVRSYALFLGFNDEELSAALEAVDFDDNNNPAPQSVYTPIDQSPLSRKRIVAFVVALGIVAGGAYAYVEYANLFSDDIIPSTAVTSTAKPAPPLMQPTPPVPAAPAAPATPTAPVQSAPAKNISAPSSPVAPSRTPVPPVSTPQATAPQTVAPAANAQAAQSPQTGQTQTVQTQAAAKANQQDTHKVIITALAECWIHSNADNTDTRQFSLRKGDTFALTFSKKLTVKLGNAGGVRIRYDGEDLPVPGTDGQTRTMVFPPAP